MSLSEAFEQVAPFLGATELVALSETSRGLLADTDAEWAVRAAAYDPETYAHVATLPHPSRRRGWAWRRDVFEKEEAHALGLSDADLARLPANRRKRYAAAHVHALALTKHGGPRGVWRRRPRKHADLKRRVAAWCRASRSLVAEGLAPTPTLMRNAAEPFMRPSASLDEDMMEHRVAVWRAVRRGDRLPSPPRQPPPPPPMLPREFADVDVPVAEARRRWEATGRLAPCVRVTRFVVDGDAAEDLSELLEGAGSRPAILARTFLDGHWSYAQLCVARGRYAAVRAAVEEAGAPWWWEVAADHVMYDRGCVEEVVSTLARLGSLEIWEEFEMCLASFRDVAAVDAANARYLDMREATDGWEALMDLRDVHSCGTATAARHTTRPASWRRWRTRASSAGCGSVWTLAGWARGTSRSCRSAPPRASAWPSCAWCWRRPVVWICCGSRGGGFCAATRARRTLRRSFCRATATTTQHDLRAVRVSIHVWVLLTGPVV